MIIVSLVYNLALLVALSVASGFIDQRRYLDRYESLLQGFLFGSTAAVGMLVPLTLAPGLIFDGRSVVISLCGLFFGPPAVVVAAGMAVVLRISQGGPGAVMGVLVVLSSGLLGLLFHARWIHQDGEVSTRQLLGFGLLVHVAMLVLTSALPAGMRIDTLKHIGLPVVLTYPLATVLIGKILSDHAARGRFLEALQESERRYRLLFENMTTGFALHEMMYDKQKNPVDYRFLDANLAFEQLTGLSIASIRGRTVMEVLPGTERRWIETYAEVVRTGTPVLMEEYSSALGKWFETRAFSTGGNHFATIFADITERKRAEAGKTKLEEQYRQAQKMESIGRLAGGVAHDLNNLLTPILGFGELLLESFNTEDPRTESVQLIVEAAEKSRDLVRQLMAFGRKQVLEFKPLDLNSVVTGFEKLLQHTIRADIALHVVLGPSIPAVLGDVGQIEQVVMNLAVNAEDAMPGGGRLTIETSVTDLDAAYAKEHSGVTPGRYVLLAISDTGSGMDADTKEHIFEPFFTTKEKGKGTGLGLATVYGIVKQHGANIWVYSEPGKGTTFKIYLLAVEAVVEPLEVIQVTPAEDLRGLETILLAEDDAVVRSLAQGILEQLGYTVLPAGNGRAALSVLANHRGPVQLLLSDVVMPEMNGRELFGSISRDHPAMKVLYMSGYTENVIVHHGVLDAGVQFIQKPFTVQALAARVRQTLDDGDRGL